MLIYFFFIFNAAVSLLFICLTKKNYFLTSFNFFNFVSFGLMPIIELRTQTWYWGGAALSPMAILPGLINIYLFNISFFLGLILYQQQIKHNSENKVRKLKVCKHKLSFLFIFFTFMFASFWLFKQMPLELLFFRKFSASNLNDFSLSPSAYFLIAFFIKPIIFFSGIILCTSKIKITSKIAISCIILIIAFPTGSDRVLVAALWLPLTIILLEKIVKINNLNFFILLNCLTLSAFLGLESFRYKEGSTEFSFMQNLLGGHFDSFQMICRVSNHIPSFNLKNIFGPILFFIPRIFWDSKPVGTSFLLNSELGLTHENTSFPLIAELFFSGGQALVILGGASFALITMSVNNKIKNLFFKNGHHNTLICISFVPLYLYNLRGSLLSSFAANALFLVAWFVILKIGFIYEYIKKN